jgi:predicted GNAT family N-acyltransferase
VNVHVTVVPWATHQDRLRTVREQVFVEEQGVPRELEWDGEDEGAVHILALTEAGQAVGCARLLPSGQIGRMAVLEEWRGTGLGRRLLEASIEAATADGHRLAFLHAQTYAADFYRKAGFRETGDPFEEAGIPHIGMELLLPVAYEGAVTPIVVAEHRGVSLPAARPDTIAHALVHDGEAACVAALEEALRNPGRELAIYSQRLDPALFDAPGIEPALSTFARRAARVRVRILIHTHELLTGRTHGIVELARRLPSKVAIRRVADELASAEWSFLTWDRVGYVLIPNHLEPVASSNSYDPVTATRLMDQFDSLWASSHEDPELRTLKL